MEKDEVVILKSASVELDDGRILFIMYYYHSDKEDKKNSFNRCSLRIDTRENWEKICNSIAVENPAEQMSLGFFGLGEYKIRDTKKPYNRLSFAHRFRHVLSDRRIVKMSDFVNREYYLKSTAKMRLDYLRKYDIDGKSVDIRDAIEIPSGRWFTAEREKGRRCRIII